MNRRPPLSLIGLSFHTPAPRLRRFKKTGKRNEIFLATKFGSVSGDSERVVNGDPEYVHAAFNKSLSKLGVDYVDLYYLHRADSTVPDRTHRRCDGQARQVSRHCLLNL
jgi:aryl-alcohol dehydrogenase-like predicted oxidoreductase